MFASFKRKNTIYNLHSILLWIPSTYYYVHEKIPLKPPEVIHYSNKFSRKGLKPTTFFLFSAVIGSLESHC